MQNLSMKYANKRGSVAASPWINDVLVYQFKNSEPKNDKGQGTA